MHFRYGVQGGHLQGARRDNFIIQNRLARTPVSMHDEVSTRVCCRLP